MRRDGTYIRGRGTGTGRREIVEDLGMFEGRGRVAVLTSTDDGRERSRRLADRRSAAALMPPTSTDSIRTFWFLLLANGGDLFAR